MPIYEFKCKNCDAVFEMLVRQSDSHDSQGCPSCGFENVEKIFSCFSVGSGGGKSSAPSCAAACKVPNNGGFG